MCERGTEVALFDYADGAERILGHHAWILYHSQAPNNFAGCVARFAERFGHDHVIALDDWSEVDGFLATQRITHLYQIKCNNDGRLSKLPSVRNMIHAVFEAGDPYGEIYAKISPCVPGSCPVVPHIVQPQQEEGPDLRGELGIPPEATVFGRYGGYESFDIDVAREAVLEVARESLDVGSSDLPGGGSRIFFLFMNTPPLAEPLPNIIHVGKTSDAARKSAFIRTCDAMLHARSCGETFGLAVGEFSAHNRPVITSSEHTDNGTARMHLDVLGAKGLYYRDAPSLAALLRGFERTGRHSRVGRDWNAYRQFEPSRVMRTFEQVFLRGRARREIPEWKRWRHGSGGGKGKRGPSREEAAKMQEYHARQCRIQEELGFLRGLPKEAEAPCEPPGRYQVCAASAPCRLAPSVSAAAIGPPLVRGEVCEVLATRGLWVRLADSVSGQPRWLLTAHPEDGRLLTGL